MTVISSVLMHWTCWTNTTLFLRYQQHFVACPHSSCWFLRSGLLKWLTCSDIKWLAIVGSLSQNHKIWNHIEYSCSCSLQIVTILMKLTWSNYINCAKKIFFGLNFSDFQCIKWWLICCFWNSFSKSKYMYIYIILRVLQVFLSQVKTTVCTVRNLVVSHRNLVYF